MSEIPTIGKLSIRQQAQQEIDKEFANKAKAEWVKKLRELHLAKLAVANIEREIQELEVATQQGNI